MAYASLFKSKKAPLGASFLTILDLNFLCPFLGLPLALLRSLP